MTRGTFFLIFILVAVVAILSYVAVVQSVKTPQEEISTQNLTPTPNPSLIPSTTLTSSPSASLVRIGASQTISILADSGENSLTTVQLELGFDPKFIEVQKVEPGTFFDNPTILLNEVDKTNGRIMLALGSLTPKKGNGVLATVTIRGISPTGPTGKTTDITFLPKTQILGSSNENLESLLRKAINAQIIVTQQ